MTNDTNTTAESISPARLRLDAARAALAASALATAPADAPTVEPGTVVHCLDDHGIVVPRSTSIIGEPALHVFRGDTFTVTSEMLEASKNGAGVPGGVSLAADEVEQVRRWGKVRLRVGEAPSDLPRWTHGTAEWREAREAARKSAWSITDPDERAEARARVEQMFGPAPVTSVTLNESPDPSIAAAEAQRRRLDASGVRQVNNYAPTRRGGE